jgi:hypothetical protein
VADTFTANLNLTQPQVGGSRDSWGGKLNSDLTLIDNVFDASGNGTSVGINIGSGKVLKIVGTLSASGLTISPTEISYLDGVSSSIQTQLNGKAANGANSDITSITGLTTALAVNQGGTGSTTASAARASLSAAQSGANSDITSITGLTTALAINQGGTGSTTASAARAALSAAQSGANSDITSLSGLTTPLSPAQGGTGSNVLTNNSVVVGGGAGAAVKLVAPGAAGNVLTSNGITWVSSVGGGGGGGFLITGRAYFCSSFYS